MARAPRRSGSRTRRSCPRPAPADAGAVRWRRRKDARPSEIAAAALDVFAERGFTAARLDDVAARAGVTKGTVYLYFDSKEELLKAVVQESLIPNIAEAERLVQEFSGPTTELLRKLITTIGGIIAETKIGAIPKIIISESGNFPDLARFYVREVIQRGLRLLATVLERGIARGEFRPVDVPHTVPALASSFLFLAIWKHAMERHATQRLDTDAFLQAYLDVALNGLAVRKE